jgi:hypothetical protein
LRTDRVDDGARIVFDPSGLRICRKHLELTLADWFEPSVKHDGTSARGSLVDDEKMVARQWQTLPKLWRTSCGRK